MVRDTITCPCCGKVLEVAIPYNKEITQIKPKSFWNIFSFRKGSLMYSKCEGCNCRISVWFRDTKFPVYRIDNE